MLVGRPQYKGIAMSAIESTDFENAVRVLLTEIFSEVHGIVLDKGTTLFETLSEITAVQASIPVGGQCATLAAQVRHVAFYLDVFERSLREPDMAPVDWDEIWRNTSAVNEAEWAAIQDELRISYGRVLTLLDETETWHGERHLATVMAMAVHSAYHLGEIRQALCTLRS
jgi:hypothetical protein